MKKLQSRIKLDMNEIHLIDFVSDSERKSPEASFIEIQHFNLEQDARVTLFMHPPSTVRTPKLLTEKEQPTMEFGVGLKPAIRKRMPGTVRMRLFLSRTGNDIAEELIWEYVLDPRKDESRFWHEVELMLEVDKGEEFFLRFETRSEGLAAGAHAWSGWSDPVLQGVRVKKAPLLQVWEERKFSRPNVLLLTADGLRADCLNNERIGTPHIDALREESVSFPQARTSYVNTTGAYCGLLTGRFSKELGALTETDGLPLYVRSMPLSLAEKGYRTLFLPSKHDTGQAAAGFQWLFHKVVPSNGNPSEDGGIMARRLLRELDSMPQSTPWFIWTQFFDVHPPAHVPKEYFRPNPAGPVRDRNAVEQIRGIETYSHLQSVQTSLSRGEWPPLMDRTIKKTAAYLQGAPVMATDIAELLPHAPAKLRRGLEGYEFGGWLERVRLDCVAADQVTPEMAGWLSELEEFFIEAEKNILPWPEDFDEIDYIHRGFDASVRYLDAQIGKVIAGLKQRNLYEDTLIVFTSPHGNLLGEEGVMFHHHLDHEAVFRVPLMFRLPGNYEARQTIESRGAVSLLDVYPTLGKFLEYDVPPDVKGKVLWPPQAEQPKERIIIGDDSFLRSVCATTEEYKLVRGLISADVTEYDFMEAGEERFFKIGSDEVKQERIDSIPPNIYARLKDAIDEWEKLPCFREEFEAKPLFQEGAHGDGPSYDKQWAQAHPTRVNDVFWLPTQHAAEASSAGHAAARRFQKLRRQTHKGLVKLSKGLAEIQQSVDRLTRSKRWKAANLPRFMQAKMKGDGSKVIPYGPLQKALDKTRQRLTELYTISGGDVSEHFLEVDIDSGVRIREKKAAAIKEAGQNLARVGFIIYNQVDPVELKRTLNSLHALIEGGSCPLIVLAEAHDVNDDEQVHRVAPGDAEGLREMSRKVCRDVDWIFPLRSGCLVDEALLAGVIVSAKANVDTRVLYGHEAVVENNTLTWEPALEWDDDLFVSSPCWREGYLFQRDLLNDDSSVWRLIAEGQIACLLVKLRENGITPSRVDIPTITRREPLVLPRSYRTLLEEWIVSWISQKEALPARIESSPLPNTFRLTRPIVERDLVSIIIPTRDRVELLRNCIQSIREITEYENYEIIVVDNESEKPETLEYLEKEELRVVKHSGNFNFSAMNNMAAKEARGEYLLFLNNDTEAADPQWLSAMLEHGQRAEVGAVGARLHYGDFTIQHAGVSVQGDKGATHCWTRILSAYESPMMLAGLTRQVAAVTAACMLTRKKAFLQAGGFDENNLAVSFNDIDYCLRLREDGLKIIYTPHAALLHLESASRGRLDKAEEVNYFLSRAAQLMPKDPFYPSLT